MATKPTQVSFTVRMDSELLAKLDRVRDGLALDMGLPVSRNEFWTLLGKWYLESRRKGGSVPLMVNDTASASGLRHVG